MEVSCSYVTYAGDRNFRRINGVSKGDARIIHDTRSAVVVDHELEPAGHQLLDSLGDPMDKQRLSSKLVNLSDAELEGQLNELNQRGLLFEEDGRYLSLVLDAPPRQRHG